MDITVPGGKTTVKDQIILSAGGVDIAWKPGDNGAVTSSDDAVATAALDDTTGNVIISRVASAGGAVDVTYTRDGGISATTNIVFEATVINPDAARFDNANAVIS